MKRSVWAIGHVLRISSQIGKGSLTQLGLRWSKSVAQSLTGGRALMASPSLFDDLDGKFWTVRLGQVGLFLQAGWHRAVADLACITVLVEFEQLRGDGLAAIVALTFVGIDADAQTLGVRHGISSLPRGGPYGC